MNIDVLKARRNEILSSSEESRKLISSLLDEKSFVEISACNFSSDEINSREGVITGFGSIEGYPLYLVVQNFKIENGAISASGAEKILKCMELAKKSNSPIAYIINSYGVKLNDGLKVLENVSKILKQASLLKGVLPQFAIFTGDTFGSLSLLSGIADFTLMLENSVLTSSSPVVISAKSGKALDKNAVGGVKVHKENTGVCAVSCKDMADAKASLLKIMDILPSVSGEDIETLEDMNKIIPSLNVLKDIRLSLKEIFDKDYYIELNESFEKSIITSIGRIAGKAVAVLAFDKEENGVELTTSNLRKIRKFYDLVQVLEIPLINFVNVNGIKPSLDVEKSFVMSDINDLIFSLSLIDTAKIAVITGSAIGLGYSLFASKGMGYDYSIAYADSNVSLLNPNVQAEIELSDMLKSSDLKTREALVAVYVKDNANPLNAGNGGYVDNIIEPAFVRQHLVAALQMLNA